jgi:hypothetical protein
MNTQENNRTAIARAEEVAEAIDRLNEFWTLMQPSYPKTDGHERTEAIDDALTAGYPFGVDLNELVLTTLAWADNVRQSLATRTNTFDGRGVWRMNDE